MKNRSNKLRITGWALSILLALFLAVASALPKFIQWEGKADMFAKLGWTEDVMFTIGIVEAAIAVLFLIPRVAFVAAILLTAYLGGATATHIRVNDPFYFPILTGVFAWIALGLRKPEVFWLALRKDASILPVPSQQNSGESL